MVFIERAVIALGRHAPQHGLATRAFAEAERARLLEAELEARLVVELVHLDRVVGTCDGAERAAGAVGLVDEDLLARDVEGYSVEVARVDAALISAGVAGVDEVEVAEDATVEREALAAVAIFAGLLAGAALDAGVELAHAQRHRHREPVTNEEVGDDRLCARGRFHARLGRRTRAPQTIGHERVALPPALGELAIEREHGDGRDRVDAERIVTTRSDGDLDDVAFFERREVLLGGADQRTGLRAAAALLLVELLAEERVGRDELLGRVALDLEAVGGELAERDLPRAHQHEPAADGDDGVAIDAQDLQATLEHRVFDRFVREPVEDRRGARFTPRARVEAERTSPRAESDIAALPEASRGPRCSAP